MHRAVWLVMSSFLDLVQVYKLAALIMLRTLDTLIRPIRNDFARDFLVDKQILAVVHQPSLAPTSAIIGRPMGDSAVLSLDGLRCGGDRALSTYPVLQPRR